MSAASSSELRLFLEDLCCDLCVFEEVFVRDAPAESVQIDREVFLGTPGLYADVRVATPNAPPYFIEVKVGVPTELVVRRLAEKYRALGAAHDSVERLVLVIDVTSRRDWPAALETVRARIDPRITLEVWTEGRLRELVRECLGVEMGALDDHALVDLRERTEAVLGFHAFGGASLSEYRNDPLKAELLWHLGAPRIRALRRAGRSQPRDVLPPGTYRDVAVLVADLSGFSSFVRDTRDPELIREALTSFYTKSRYQIVVGGGMLYQFVGDAVLGFFGLPDNEPGAATKCLHVARALLDIGDSVSDHWQRHIDRVQPNRGVHIGLTVGDVELMSLRPFSRTRIGAVSDSINVASRLLASADAGEIVASNSFIRRLGEGASAGFVELAPIDARNVGRIKAWKASRARSG